MKAKGKIEDTRTEGMEGTIAKRNAVKVGQGWSRQVKVLFFETVDLAGNLREPDPPGEPAAHDIYLGPKPGGTRVPGPAYFRLGLVHEIVYQGRVSNA